MTEVTPVFCDWMTGVGVVAKTGSWLRHMLGQEFKKPVHGAFSHTHGVEYFPSGWKHYFTPAHTESQSVLLVTGQAWVRLRQQHGRAYADKVLGMTARQVDHFSRLDLTVDIMDNGRTAKEVSDWADGELRAGRFTWNRRKLSVVRSNGVTTYIGVRSSPLMMRIYDKFAESGGEIPATRVEIEIKGDLARECTPHLARYEGYLNPGRLFTNFLLRFGDWARFQEIENLCYGDVVSVDAIERDDGDKWERWVRRQVLPGMSGTPGSPEFSRLLWMRDQLQQMINDATE